MKKLRELTQKERCFAEQNHDLVMDYLKYHGLPEDEFYDVVIFAYLLAVQEYLTDPRLRQYKFATIASRKMRNAVAEEYRYRNRSKRAAAVREYTDADALHELDQLLPCRKLALEEQLYDQEIVRHLLSYITPKEREAVFLKAEGYTYKEIAQHCQISVYGVQSRFTRFRKRLMTTRIVPQQGGGIL